MDNVTTQSATLATVPTATTFSGYSAAGGVVHFPIEFVSGGGPNAWTFQAVDGTHGLPVAILGSVTVNAGNNLNTSALALETGGNLAILAGAVSSAVLQANVAEVGGSALALGQQLAAASLPVVLTAAQLTSLTAPVLGAGTNVIGHVIVDSGTITTLTTVNNLAGATASAIATQPAQVTVGMSAMQLDAVGSTCKFGVVIKALNSNTGTVYIGSSSGVTASTGFELGAGESISIPVNSTNVPWAIASAASQKISLLGV